MNTMAGAARRRPSPVWGILGIAFAAFVKAETLPLPPEDVDLVGVVQVVPARHEDTLLDIARRFHLGHDEIVIANPDVDRWLPGEDKSITLPPRYIMPDAKRRGLVLNVPEMRVYYYPPTNPGETLVLKSNMHYDQGKPVLYTLNYQLSGLIPMCEEITVVKKKKKSSGQNKILHKPEVDVPHIR